MPYYCDTTFIGLVSSISYLFFIVFLLLLLAGDIHPNPGPSQHLKAIHINVCSIRKKIPLIQAQLKDFDILTISETWLSDSVCNDDILLNGYHPPVRKDKPNAPYGGVAIYVKDNLICKSPPDLDNPLLEAVWVETKLGQDTLLVGSFYRPPDSKVEYWTLVDNSIEQVGSLSHKYIVLGDFNADCSNEIPNHLQDIISKNNLYQLVTSPTRITDKRSTTIDLVLTPCRDIVSDVSVLPPVCSDHSGLVCTSIRIVGYTRLSPIRAYRREKSVCTSICLVYPIRIFAFKVIAPLELR